MSIFPSRKADFFLISVISLSPTTLFAAPSIENAYLKDMLLVISGSGFGDTTSRPLLYDMVDNQTIYESIPSNTVVTPDNSPWGEVSEYIYGRTPPKIVKDGDLRYPNATVAYEGAVSFVGKPDVMRNSDTNSLYVSWFFKTDTEIGSPEANKFIRIWDKLDGSGLRLSWTSMHLTYNVVDRDYSPPAKWQSTLPRVNSWSHFEIYANADEGVIEAKLNGETKHYITDFVKSTSNDGLNIGLIGFDPVDNEKYSDLQFRMKDIYVSTSLARVEISQSPSWDPTAKREILSFNNWTNNQIEANVNYTVGNLSPQFIYVIHADGSVNKEGFPVLCGNCPMPPEAINIE